MRARTPTSTCCLANDDRSSTDRLRDRLSREIGRSVDLVALDAARRDPLLLEAALHEGRVLVDRDGDWHSLVAEKPEIGVAADAARVALRDELHGLLADLSS